MPVATINYWAVLACGIASMVIGSLWYGPLFGKLWMKFEGITQEKMAEMKKGMMKSYLLMFVGSLVTAYVLAYLVDYAQASNVKAAAQVGFWLWLGFVAPVMMGAVLWSGKSWKWWILSNASELITVIVMAIILVKWV